MHFAVLFVRAMIVSLMLFVNEVNRDPNDWFKGDSFLAEKE